MNAPSGFHRSRLHWFACPHCAYHSYVSYLAGKVSIDRKGVNFVFWCASCGRFSVLKHQWLWLGTAVLYGLGTFALLYWLIDTLWDSSFIWLGVWVACAIVSFVGLSALIGRFIFEYVA